MCSERNRPCRRGSNWHKGGPITRALAFARKEAVAALRIDPSCFLTAFDFSVATSVRPTTPVVQMKSGAQSGRSKSVHHTFGSSPHVAVSALTSFESILNASLRLTRLLLFAAHRDRYDGAGRQGPSHPRPSNPLSKSRELAARKQAQQRRYSTGTCNKSPS